ncbi:sugar ABC transporter ATP-binding protein [Alkalibacillus haloalkaliphilus]|uniref:sugar ABC transporter ATP-binding protein n=1 Tax=Alkalibacillus haloalkaliphilus TaxID=94136 RepID=UPI002935A892|nr:sugar ABC transporter ATP-binding protein [Alkalibacillus haloalkaliphilus]MDV2581915.1 sugar ABC transporter ATP-binding protein [Alkalibacillus haloalkaliphilus]
MQIEMLNVNKSFGSNNVLEDVSITVNGGEIYALLGENGAGKSTLMNILGGVLPLDRGEICINGESVSFEKPADSQSSGIAFIHQELNLINDLPVYENMFIGREPKKRFGQLDHKKMIKETEDLFKSMDIDLDPKAMVGDLDASYKQIVEICRAMSTNASIIIMDEPTTSLTDTEINRVFGMMNTLREQGVGLIFISHKLKEVKRICDRYAVLRDGGLVSEGYVDDVTINDIARFMVGYDVRTEPLIRERPLGEEVLRIENLTYEQQFKDINFSIKAGEVVGFTGLLGDGRSELFQSIFGSKGISSGAIYVNDKKVSTNSTMDAIKNGIAYLPRNRKENAIISDMDILENSAIATWPQYSKFGIINKDIHKQQFEKQRDKLNIKMDKWTDNITKLSGGNQQKVVLSKWLNTGPKILILDNPTQGVDVGAKEDIYDIILDLADQKIAVVVLSSEAQEIIRVCDRTMVMYHGTVQGELKGKEMTDHNIMTLATGGELELEGEGKPLWKQEQ